MRHSDFERLFREHAQPLYGFLAYRTGDPMLAEDLLGDVFERAIRARRRFDPRKGSERAWIYTIALNCLRDHLRRAGAERRAVSLMAAGAPREWAGDAERIDDRDLLARGMEHLSADEREVVGLRFGADLGLEEIARVLDLPASTVRGRLYSALAKLRDALPDR